VHCLEGATPRALLLLVGAAAGGALGAGEDAARREDDDVTVGELLLEFAGEPGLLGWTIDCCGVIPLLDLVPVGQQRDRDEDDDGLAAVADVDLVG
jgi:hypothetical protein